mmetsp:Transcript_19679/g.78250  ORF Transcript_19679/g.78250 Transcript_19679/m.78250 type:complete len:81 (-) Transcript_19679:1251-1493(-)
MPAPNSFVKLRSMVAESSKDQQQQVSSIIGPLTSSDLARDTHQGSLHENVPIKLRDRSRLVSRSLAGRTSFPASAKLESK